MAVALGAMSAAASPRTRIVLFPLQNTSGDPLVEWIGYSVAESFFTRLSQAAGITVWSPIFLFRVDSSGWTLQSDSVVLAHARRWKWDVAVGGLFKADNDSVWLRLRSVRPGAGGLEKKAWRAKGEIESVRKLCAQLAFDLLVSMGHEFSPEEAAGFKKEERTEPDAYAVYVRGFGYEMCAQPGNALSAYKYAVDIDRRLGEAYSRMAMLYDHAGQVKEAREAHVRAVEILSSSPRAIAAMAEFLVDNDTPERAAEFISRHRSLLETSSIGLRAIGTSLIASGEYQRAIAILTRAVAAGPPDLQTDFALGRTYFRSGQYEQAIDVFQRLIEYRPGYVRYYSLLGAAYREQARYMESSKVLELAARLAPDDVPNLINLATTYYKIGWHHKAEQMLVRARDLAPEMGAVYLNLGVLYWKAGRGSDAREMFARAAGQPRTRQSAFNNEANMLLLSGDIKNAVTAYRRAEKEGEKNEVILYNLGLAYEALDKKKEAAECFNEVLLLAPGRLDVLARLASLAEQMGQEEDAEQYYRKIVQAAPQNREALKSLVRLLKKMQRYEEAAEFVKNALEDFPGDRLLRLLLPEIYAAMEWHEVAIMEWEQLALDKDFRNELRVFLGLARSNFALIRDKGGNHYDKTILYLKRAVELAPGNAEPEIMLGHIYKDYKNYPSLALEHWRRALSKADDAATRRKLRTLIAEAAE